MDYSKYVEILKEAKKEISADDLMNALAEATAKEIGNDPILSLAMILFAKGITHEVMCNLFPELEERLKAVDGRDAEDE